jgi:DNA-directed RNA polymerase specialized sigma24 family protein
MAELKKDWIVSPDAFRRLLQWLDDGGDSGGEQYLEMRRRLTGYFDRKNCIAADELVDETLNRIARKLEEKGEITEISRLHYCYIVAKFVFLENVRQSKPIQAEALNYLSPDSPTIRSTHVSNDGTDELSEKTFGCLEKCLGELSANDRELILEYYRGEKRAKIERRSELTARLGITMNALSIRACRIRNKLEVCVKRCCGQT